MPAQSDGNLAVGIACVDRGGLYQHAYRVVPALPPATTLTILPEKPRLADPGWALVHRGVFPGSVWDVEETWEEDVSNSKGGLREGHKIQNFELPDQTDGAYDLHRRLREGTLVLVFYRGDW
jgi:hypothetical protein